MATTQPFMPLEEAISLLRIDDLSEHDQAGSACERLLGAIERHIQGESSALTEYARLGEASHDAVIGMVMRLILEDEERHHGLLLRIATSLRDALNWTRTADALPSASAAQPPISPELRSVARGLIQEELDGARALRDLAAREKGIDGGLPSLLLEMMALDSEKHAHLLRFVSRRLERATPAN
jgi:hypothetical protein